MLEWRQVSLKFVQNVVESFQKDKSLLNRASQDKRKLTIEYYCHLYCTLTRLDFNYLPHPAF